MDVLNPGRIRPTLHFKDKQIEMAHGAGGKAARRLVEGLIVPYFANPTLAALGDAAVIAIGREQLATTADGFVVRPLSFPGGSIGELAVNGTINDLAVSGARPLALMATFILEAGLDALVFEREVAAMAHAARRAGVAILGGDTKVVEHGLADGMYVTTFGLGSVDPRARLGAQYAQVGDRVIVSGPLGDHGITILLARGDLELEADLTSDTQPLWDAAAALLDACGTDLRWMRDPTRGGVATTLNELTRVCRLGILLSEDDVPVRANVRGACEILGLDPLHIANEGRLLAIVAPASLEAALAALRAVSGCEEATVIGELVAENPGGVASINGYGGTRIVDMLVGDPLPRIC